MEEWPKARDQAQWATSLPAVMVWEGRAITRGTKWFIYSSFQCFTNLLSIIHLPWTDASTLWVLPKALTRNLISHFKWHKEKTSFCFYTGPVTGTPNVKMGQAVTCKQPFYFSPDVKQTQYRWQSCFYASAHFHHLLPFISFIPSAHLQPYMSEEMKHQASKKRQEKMSHENKHIFSHRHEGKYVSVSRIISVLNLVGIKGCCGKTPCPQTTQRWGHEETILTLSVPSSQTNYTGCWCVKSRSSH